MSPRAIIDAALAKGLDLIAVTDHNTAEMSPVMAETARSHGLAYLYGLELQTREDAHLLAYFDDEATCLAFSREMYNLLPDIEDPYGLGDQVQVDADETIVRTEPKFLVAGLDISFADAALRIYELGGLPVPAHIDREVFSVTSQMGRLPEGVDFPLIEVRGETVPEAYRDRAILRNSDSHFPEAIGQRITHITVEAVTIPELIKAAAGEGGRSIVGELRP